MKNANTRTALITGFDSFGDVDPNASGLCAKRAAKAIVIRGWRVVGAVLPTVFDEVVARVPKLIDRHRPDILLMTGVANTPALRLERLAVNRCDAPGRPDNAGAVRLGSPVIPGAPDAYRTKFWDDDTLLDKLCAAGIPAFTSMTAGTYVCNAALFAALHHIAAKNLPACCAFVHIPRAPSDVARLPEPRRREIPSWPIDQSLAGLALILRAWVGGVHKNPGR